MKKLICCVLVLLPATVALGVAASGAEPRPATANLAATANNDLAFDLYAQLARQSSGKAVCFSPYSICNALGLVAEGARHETADEMGKVLRLPATTRRTGKDARERPWDLGPVHAGLASLNRRFEVASQSAPKAVVDRLASLREALQEANRKVRSKSDVATRREARKRAVEIAAEINKLQAQVERFEVRLANALWAEKSYPLSQSYLDTINKHHGVSAIPVDFRKDHEEARKRINAWVEKQTRDRIRNLIPPRALDRDTRLVIANAIYFKGQWSEPFRPRQTRDLLFTLADGKEVEVATMHGYRYADRYGAFEKGGKFFSTPLRVQRGKTDSKALYPGPDGFEVLELPYKGDELSMVVVRPRSADGLAAVEKLLSGANLRAWLGELRQRQVEVFLPKFKLEMPLDLKKGLQALGMKRAFRDPGMKAGAQFDGLSEAREAVEKLYVSQVLHRAFVEVSEKGTEAAAATAAVMKKKGKKDQPEMVPFTPTFRADRPFVFLIRDRQSGAVLFLGRVLNPTKGS